MTPAQFARLARGVGRATRPLRITPQGLVIGFAVDILLGLLVEWLPGGMDDTASGFTRCGQCANPNYEGYPDGPFYISCGTGTWSNLSCNLATNCLSNQAGSECTPTSTTRRFYKAIRRTVPDTGQFRYQLIEAWEREDAGPIVNRPNRPAVPAPVQRGWPVHLPLPPIYSQPGGPIAPHPLPTSPAISPYVPTVPRAEPRGAPGRRGDYERPFVRPNPNPGWRWEVTVPMAPPGPSQPWQPPGQPGTGSNPGTRPSPIPSPAPRANPNRPGPRERERKQLPKVSQAALGVKRVLEEVLEVFDVVEALFTALPPEVRRKYRNPSPADQARALWDNWKEIDIADAFCLLALNQLEDFAYGRWGQLAGRAGAYIGSPLGGQSLLLSRRDRRNQLIGNRIEDMYEEAGRDPPERAAAQYLEGYCREAAHDYVRWEQARRS